MTVIGRRSDETNSIQIKKESVRQLIPNRTSVKGKIVGELTVCPSNREKVGSSLLREANSSDIHLKLTKDLIPIRFRTQIHEPKNNDDN